jgi:predicted dienelactone hydrolase
MLYFYTNNIPSKKMKKNTLKPFYTPFLIVLFSCFFIQISYSQGNNADEFIFGDALPDAPELAARGKYKVGVRTIDLLNKQQVDVLNSKEGVDAYYDRPLKVEVWYPAILNENEKEFTTYTDNLGMPGDPKRPLIPFSFKGRAAQNASPVLNDGKFPLIIVSHGYTGSRVLMTYLTENLASKGYVVVAIDHYEATHADAKGFPSTLLNRSKDILFVLNEMANKTKVGSPFFLTGIVDSDNTAIIGYSMGGYGVLNVAGAGYSEQMIKTFGSLTGGSKAIEVRTTNNEAYKASFNTRIKAVVAFAPWGMERGVWDADGLKGLRIPTFFVAGNLDDVSGYEKGIKAIYTGAINADRYMLTYINARHNIAPNPPSSATLTPGLNINEYYHYAEPSWDQRRINNINQHFVTAFLGKLLKKEDTSKYLNLPQNSNEKTWEGFKARSSTGLELMHNEATK